MDPLPAVRVGRCLVMPQSRQVLVDGREVSVGGRAFDLLMALIEHRGRVATKESLYERIWPGVAVEPNNLQVQICMLRRLLGPHALKTVPRRGYQLTAPVALLSGVAAFGPKPHPSSLEGSADALLTQAEQIARRLACVPMLLIVGGDASLRLQLSAAAAQCYAEAASVGQWRLETRSAPDGAMLDPLQRLARIGGVLRLDDMPLDAVAGWCRWVDRMAWPHTLRLILPLGREPLPADGLTAEIVRIGEPPAMRSVGSMNGTRPTVLKEAVKGATGATLSVAADAAPAARLRSSGRPGAEPAWPWLRRQAA